ncbi:chromosomal replication initiator DnaA [Ascidiaceihabitans sp.]|uniref:chromosomal replication initiator DnaA n=1 Tax=Ascidiaceihabitans sp. TaxID=1872644 RepID=UPI00329A61D1
MAEQLNFDLPPRTALGRDDFLISPSNAVAVSMIDRTPAWSLHKMVLCGPSGAGKTHLVHVWAKDVGARIVDAAALTEDMVPALASTPVALEDLDQIAQNATAQAAAFHLHNMMFAAQMPLLMTGTGAPNLWCMGLADLQSRIDAAGVAVLDAPDDTLLAAVMAKLFHDRQVQPASDVIPYLVLRMDRSFEAARQIVAVLDHACLTEQRKLTRSYAATVLDKIL